MSWKNVRDHYHIEHIVRVEDGKILIGSPYIPDILTIDPDGTVRDGKLGHRGNADLERYWRDLTADPAKLRDLIAAPDTFDGSLTVYTYDGAAIIEKQCEVLGWPNCTHDGQIMYDNTFSADRAAVVRRAKENAAAAVSFLEGAVADAMEKLAGSEARLSAARECVVQLDAAEPLVVEVSNV